MSYLIIAQVTRQDGGMPNPEDFHPLIEQVKQQQIAGGERSNEHILWEDVENNRIVVAKLYADAAAVDKAWELGSDYMAEEEVYFNWVNLVSDEASTLETLEDYDITQH